jgi:hypothetical protein
LTTTVLRVVLYLIVDFPAIVMVLVIGFQKHRSPSGVAVFRPEKLAQGQNCDPGGTATGFADVVAPATPTRPSASPMATTAVTMRL